MNIFEFFNYLEVNVEKIFSINYLHQYMSYSDIPTSCTLLLDDIPLHVPQILVKDRLNCLHLYCFVLHKGLQLEKKLL